MTDSTLVAVKDVPCPHGGEHPDGHVVSMKPKIGLEGAVYARRKASVAAEKGDPDLALVNAVLCEAYVRYGVAEIDGVPATPEDIEALIADEDAGTMIAERGDVLYSVPVLAPFVRRARALSLISQTDGSTSPPTPGSTKPRRRSKRSSTSTTQTDSIETTSTVPA